MRIGQKGHPVSVHPFLVGLDGKWSVGRTEGTSNECLSIHSIGTLVTQMEKLYKILGSL